MRFLNGNLKAQKIIFELKPRPLLARLRYFLYQVFLVIFFNSIFNCYNYTCLFSGKKHHLYSDFQLFVKLESTRCAGTF